MSNVGIGFYVPDEVQLTLGARHLTVDFSDAEVCRLIVIEPEVRYLLPQIMAGQERYRIMWADLRSLLEAQGLDLRALVVDNRAGPKQKLVSRREGGFGRDGRPAL
jgi:hypothetical protein